MWMCGFAQCSVNPSWRVSPDGSSPSQRDSEEHSTNISCPVSFCGTEKEEELFAEGDMLASAGPGGSAEAPVSVPVCGAAIHVAVGPADAPSSLWI